MARRYIFLSYFLTKTTATFMGYYCFTYVHVKEESYCCAHLQIHTYIHTAAHTYRTGAAHNTRTRPWHTCGDATTLYLFRNSPAAHTWRDTSPAHAYSKVTEVCPCGRVIVVHTSSKAAAVMLCLYTGMLLHAYMLELKWFTIMTKRNWRVHM